MKTILSDLIAEQSLVDSLIDGLTEEQWNETIATDIKVGDIPGIWTIKDVILHVALFDRAAAKLMLGEAESLKEANKGVQDANYRCINERNWSKGDVLSWWREGRTRMNNAFYNCDPKDRIPWAPGMPMSARALASARLMETWAHSVDIYDQLRLPVRVADRIAHTLFLAYQARPNAYRINGFEVSDIPIYMELVLPSGEIWAKGPQGAENYIKGSAAEWALVSIRRRNWMDTGLEIAGDEARKFASIVQTYAGEADEAPAPKRIR
jgi:TIGR03084 family protein